MFRDGGTIGIEFIDSRGTEHELCVDGRVGTHTPNRLYVNARHPVLQPAKFVPRGSKDEKRIVKYLQDFLDNNWPMGEQENLRDAYGQRELSEEEEKAALCISAIERIKNSGK